MAATLPTWIHPMLMPAHLLGTGGAWHMLDIVFYAVAACALLAGIWLFLQGRAGRRPSTPAEVGSSPPATVTTSLAADAQANARNATDAGPAERDRSGVR